MKGTASKMVQNQTASSEVVVNALNSHKQTVAKHLFETQKSPPAKRLTQAEIGRWLEWLSSELDAYGNELWDRELSYTNEQSDDSAVISARDEAGNILDDALRTTRNSAEQICGAHKLSDYGLTVPPPTDLVGRKKYAENALALLRKNAAPITKFGQTFEPAAIADSIDAALADYATALAADITENRQLEAAKERRDLSMNSWKLGYHSIAAQVEGLFRQSGRSYLAERVRPTERRIRGDEAPPADVDADVVNDPAQPEVVGDEI